ncbi:NAD-dependent epimerase/dehydratase family protein [Inquilinus ginsengisoli]|uniref:NAD-dependent epimerase/dehydratase family protein n=1 Tax=Inquilinus ginsengisoli TaxID=363840 RepID=UPI003D2171AA
MGRRPRRVTGYSESGVGVGSGAPIAEPTRRHSRTSGYPRDAVQPIREDELLTGPLEQTNEGYAIAKITGVKLVETYACQYGCRFVSVMPERPLWPE